MARFVICAGLSSKKFAKEDFVCSPTYMRITKEVNKTPHLRRVELNSATEFGKYEAVLQSVEFGMSN